MEMTPSNVLGVVKSWSSQIIKIPCHPIPHTHISYSKEYLECPVNGQGNITFSTVILENIENYSLTTTTREQKQAKNS